MKLGVLYPRSNQHPGMMVDFVEGIKTSLVHLKIDHKIQLLTESIGFGGVEKEVYEKVEKLLELEKADMLISFVDLRILEVIKPLLNASGKLLLVVNPGANYPENWLTHPNILNLTLQHSFLSWLTGKEAAKKSNKKAAMATTFYDCGYMHTAAMVKGFESGGGEITYNYVNNQRYDEAFEIKPLTDFLTSDKDTNSLICLFDSSPAQLFYAKLNSHSGLQDLHLFVSPMMLEKKALEKITDEFSFNITGYLPWHQSVNIDENLKFQSFYAEQTKRSASVFSLLGWESGQIIAEIVLNNLENYADVADITGSLGQRIINSPRGALQLDIKTNYFLSPVYKCSVIKKSSAQHIDQLGIPLNDWKKFTADQAAGVFSGWTNTYLCY